MMKYFCNIIFPFMAQEMKIHNLLNINADIVSGSSKC